MGDSPEDTGAPPWDDGENEAADNTPSAAELEAAGQNSMFGDPGPAPEPAVEPTSPPIPAAASAPAVFRAAPAFQPGLLP